MTPICPIAGQRLCHRMNGSHATNMKKWEFERGDSEKVGGSFYVLYQLSYLPESRESGTRTHDHAMDNRSISMPRC